MTDEKCTPNYVEKKEIRYGTPIIDGKLDDLYFDSFCYEEKPMVNMSYSPWGRAGAEKYMPNTCGKAYFLYDEDYLYVCVTIHDETICTRGEKWRMETQWPWNDDGAEIYLWFSDEDSFAVHSDAHGYRSVVDEHVWGENHDSAGTYHDTPDEDWAASIDEENQNYTIEIRIKLPDYIKEGSYIGAVLEIDDHWDPSDENMVGALMERSHFAGDPRFRLRLGKK